MAKVREPITSFDRQTAREVSEEVIWCLEEWAKDNGLVAQYNGGRFGRTEFQLRLTLAVQPKGGKSLERVQFEKSCGLFGLKPGHYGANVVIRRRAFTLVGCQPRRHKYPFVGQGPQGGKYKLTEAAVKQALGLGVKTPAGRGDHPLMTCPKCKKQSVRSTSRRLGPESVLITSRCTTPRCTYTEQDMLD